MPRLAEGLSRFFGRVEILARGADEERRVAENALSRGDVLTADPIFRLREDHRCGYVDQMFFPESSRNQYYIDLYFPEGTKITETERQVALAEEHLLAKEGVTHTASFVGGGQIRFLLIYTPESLYQSYAQVLVTVDDYKRIQGLMVSTLEELEEMFPQAIVNTKAFLLGPSEGGKLQLRINGPDYDLGATFYLADLPPGPATIRVDCPSVGSWTYLHPFEVLRVPYQWDWGFRFHNQSGFSNSWRDLERDARLACRRCQTPPGDSAPTLGFRLTRSLP